MNSCLFAFFIVHIVNLKVKFGVSPVVRQIYPHISAKHLRYTKRSTTWENPVRDLKSLAFLASFLGIFQDF